MFCKWDGLRFGLIVCLLFVLICLLWCLRFALWGACDTGLWVFSSGFVGFGILVNY